MHLRAMESRAMLGRLAALLALAVSGNRVYLTFHKDHLGDYKTDEPLAA